MAGSEDLSRIERPDVSQTPTHFGGLSPSLIPPLDAAERERLLERASEARMRTMELIARSLELRADSDEMEPEAGRAMHDADHAALSASVTKYARLLRALGEPPERALVVIKTAFSEAVPRPDASHRAMLEQVVRWAVDAYFVA